VLPPIKETGEQLPVAHLAIALLSDILQNDRAFPWKGTPESLRGGLHEGFHPACDASGPPEFGAGWLGQDRHKMISDSLAGQGEKWPVPFIVKLQVTGGTSVTKGVVDAAQDNGRVSYRYSLLCHDASTPFT
jgi:hypothetical protein